MTRRLGAGMTEGERGAGWGIRALRRPHHASRKPESWKRAPLFEHPEPGLRPRTREGCNAPRGGANYSKRRTLRIGSGASAAFHLLPSRPRGCGRRPRARAPDRLARPSRLPRTAGSDCCASALG